MADYIGTGIAYFWPTPVYYIIYIYRRIIFDAFNTHLGGVELIQIKKQIIFFSDILLTYWQTAKISDTIKTHRFSSNNIK